MEYPALTSESSTSTESKYLNICNERSYENSMLYRTIKKHQIYSKEALSLPFNIHKNFKDFRNKLME